MRALFKETVGDLVTGGLCITLTTLAFAIMSFDAEAKEDISVPQAYVLGQCEVLATVAAEDGFLYEDKSSELFINTLKTTAELNGVTERELVETCEDLMKEFSNND